MYFNHDNNISKWKPFEVLQTNIRMTVVDVDNGLISLIHIQLYIHTYIYIKSF